MRWLIPILVAAPLTAPLTTVQAADPVGARVEAALAGHRALPPTGLQKPDTVGPYDIERIEITVRVESADLPIELSSTVTLRATRPLSVVAFTALAWDPMLAFIEGQSAEFRSVGDEVIVELPRELQAEDRIELTFLMALSDCEESSLCGTDGAFGFFADPGLLPLSADNGLDDRFELRTRIETPAGWATAATGARLPPEERGLIHTQPFESEGLTYLPVLAWGPSLTGLQAEGRVEVLVAPSLTDAEAVLALTQEALAYLEGRFGAFPYTRLGVAPLPDTAGVALGAMAQLLLPSGLWTASEADPNLDATRLIIAHEIGHQWHYNLLGISAPEDTWLSEGFAEFGAMSFSGAQGDTSAYLRNYWGALLDVDPNAPAPLASQQAAVGPDRFAIVYQKGAVVLAMLERAYGPGFDDRLRAYIDGMAGQITTTREFRAYFEAERPDLELFFSQWLDRAVNPTLFLRVEPARTDAARSVLTIRQSEPPFVGALPLRIQFADGPSRLIETRMESAEVILGSRVKGCEVDPEHQVLAHIVPEPRGDVNLTGVVDGLDYLDVAYGFGLEHPSLEWSQILDVDGSNAIDLDDIEAIRAQIGAGW